MKVLEINQLETINAGASSGFVNGVCAGIALGSAVYAVGAATNFWNPVGWASATFIVADLACAAYAVGT